MKNILKFTVCAALLFVLIDSTPHDGAGLYACLVALGGCFFISFLAIAAAIWQAKLIDKDGKIIEVKKK